MSSIPAPLGLLALLALGCTGREAELRVRIARGTHTGSLAFYVCDAAPDTPCKRADVFVTGDADQEVGVFINASVNGTMELNFQLNDPSSCGHFDVDFETDPDITVTLNQGGTQLVVTGCESCTAPDATCTYGGRDG